MSASPLGVVATPAPVRRLFTATLILGVPGSGKTSLIATAAEYGWEVHRKVLLLASWDGGAIPTLVQKRMKQGLIRFWRARTRSASGLGIETTHLATKGYWPAEINPETGETAPNVRLVPPISATSVVCCPAGHEIYRGALIGTPQPRACGICKAIIQPAQQTTETTSTITPGFEAVGLRAFDGLTSMCTVVTEHMDLARGEGQIGGEKSSFGGVVTSGDVKFGGSNRADVGFAQSRSQQWVNNSLSIPGLVEGPIFTALSMEVADEGGLPVVGPQLSGRAATDTASAWFGNVAEQGRTKDDHGKEHFTLFLRPFTDAQGRRHLLKTSASPTGVPDKLVDPIDKPFSVANLGSVYKMLDQDLVDNLAIQDYAELPAPPPSSYGLRAETSATAAVRPVAQAAQAAQLLGAVAQPAQPVAAKPVVAVPVAQPATPVAAPATPKPVPQPVAPKPVAAPPPRPVRVRAAVPTPTTPSGPTSTPPPPGRPPQRLT